MGMSSKQAKSMIKHIFWRWQHNARNRAAIDFVQQRFARGQCYSQPTARSQASDLCLQSAEFSHMQGLTQAQAEAQLQRAGPNQLPDVAAISRWQIVRQILTEPMFVMLMIAGSLYLLLGDPWEAGLLLGFVLMVMLLTITQQQRTEHTLAALRRLSAPRALVRRGQKLYRIAAADVVCGDLLQLHEGDRVAADALLLQGVLTLNESLLTGEACGVVKNAAATNVSDRQIFASTLVLNGSAVALVTATGANTSVGQIQQDFLAAKQPSSVLQRSAHFFIRRLGLVALGLALCQLLLAWLWNGQAFMPSMLAGIALAMAILPEEIPVMLTVFFALGAWRLAQQQLLTRHIAAVEALGAVTVLAVDKTGTLTQNAMQVVAIYSADRGDSTLWTADKHSWCSTNDLAAGAFDSCSLPPSALHVIRTAVAASAALTSDAMELALQRCLDSDMQLEHRDVEHDMFTLLKEYPLTADCLATTFVSAKVLPDTAVSQSGNTNQGGNSLTVCEVTTKGAPETIAQLCRLHPIQTQQLTMQVARMAARGWRVLAVARGRCSFCMALAPQATPPLNAADDAAIACTSIRWPEQQRVFLSGSADMHGAVYEGLHSFQHHTLSVMPSPSNHTHAADVAEPQSTVPETQTTFWLNFVGLVAFADPPRPDVAAALLQCQQAGIRVLMLTGDHPETATAIAQQIGMPRTAPVLIGAALAAMTEQQLAEALTQSDIAARLQPADKTRIVCALQQQGEVVVMTGDGVNDAPALRAADVGVAMGRRGSDVAREAAAMVLLDDSFSSIVNAIAQGRRIYRNINDACRFTFAVHIPIIGLALFPLLMQWPAVLKPLHIVVLELIINPACTLLFERQEAMQTLMQQPPRHMTDSPFAWMNLAPALLQGMGITMILLFTDLLMLKEQWRLESLQGALLTLLICSACGLIWVNLTQPMLATIAPSITDVAIYGSVHHCRPQLLGGLMISGCCIGVAMLGMWPLSIGVLLIAVWCLVMRLYLSRNYRERAPLRSKVE